MHAPAPRVPSAAQIAFASAQGPRFTPGTYTARLTSGATVLTTPVTITLDRRVSFTVADRKTQFEALTRVSDLFGRMSDLVDRINAVRVGADSRAAALPAGDALKASLADLSAKADALRKQIVATKEGGAITGEERLREFTDQLYGAINSWEGPPTAYQLNRIGVLERSLAEVSAQFDALAARDLAARNAELAARKLPPISLPPTGGAGEGGGGGGTPGAMLAGYRFSLHPAVAQAQAEAREVGERD